MAMRASFLILLIFFLDAFPVHGLQFVGLQVPVHHSPFLDPPFNLINSLSARGNVVVPLRLAGASRGQARARADELLGLVGLDERVARGPSATA